MSCTIRSRKEGIVYLSVENTEYLGIASGLSPRIFRSTDPGELQNEPGWLMDAEGRMESWHIQGILEEKEELIFYGPLLKGSLLQPETIREDQIGILGRTFLLLKEKQMMNGGFYPPGCFLTEENRVLLFPRKLMEFIRKNRNEENRQNNWYPYHHPQKKGEEALSFALGTLTYHYLSGFWPYEPGPEERITEEMRTQPPVAPEIAIPGVRPEIAGILQASLTPGSTAPALSEWQDVLNVWSVQGARKTLSPEELKEKVNRLAEEQQKRQLRLKRKQFWKMKRTPFLVAAGALLLLGAFIATPIKAALAPPLTMGLSPEQVVSSYYSCFETLNQDLMEDCIDPDLAGSDLEEVTNLFVTSRIRQGYEGKSGFLPAAEWIKTGSPLPAEGVVVYGITDLTVKTAAENRFKADYVKWMPSRSETDRAPEGYRISDILLLQQQKKGNWRIVSLDRTVRELP